MSQITSHVLNTSSGKPAAGITVVLYVGENDMWHEIARAKTNADGRVTTLTDSEVLLQRGIYKLRFETKDYFDQVQQPTFYPYVEIVFDMQSSEHYHVPLLLSPFGFTTYRGS